MDIEQQGLLLVPDVAGGTVGGAVDLCKVAAVAGQRGDPEAFGIGGKVFDTAPLFRQGGDGHIVVGHQNHQGQGPDRGGGHGVVHVAFGRGAVADDGHRKTLLLLGQKALGVAGGFAKLHAHRRLHRQDAVLLHVQVVDHLPTAAHPVGVLGKLLAEDVQREVLVAVQAGPHRAEGTRAVVGHDAEAIKRYHTGDGQRGGRAMHLFAGTPDGELHLAARYQANNVLFCTAAAGAHFIGQPQIFGGRLGDVVDGNLFCSHGASGGAGVNRVAVPAPQRSASPAAPQGGFAGCARFPSIHPAALPAVPKACAGAAPGAAVQSG